jgi:hypothetical protein
MRLLQGACVIVAVAWLVAWWQTRQLPPLGAILPELQQTPRQRATARADFGFEYQGGEYLVHPVASYELHGLVVTHNDTTGLGDLTHDETSVDTKDLCVVWGANLRNEDYRRISYQSTPTWCNVSWRGADIRFDGTALANNHLVTDRAALRTALDGVHVGDQVRVKGLLVNYMDRRYPGAWRSSSTSRTDSGAGACEVVFFEELAVLKPHAVRAWQLRRGLPWVLAALLVATLAVAGMTAPRMA